MLDVLFFQHKSIGGTTVNNLSRTFFFLFFVGFSIPIFCSSVHEEEYVRKYVFKFDVEVRKLDTLDLLLQQVFICEFIETASATRKTVKQKRQRMVGKSALVHPLPFHSSRLARVTTMAQVENELREFVEELEGHEQEEKNGERILRSTRRVRKRSQRKRFERKRFDEKRAGPGDRARKDRKRFIGSAFNILNQ